MLGRGADVRFDQFHAQPPKQIRKIPKDECLAKRGHRSRLAVFHPLQYTAIIQSAEMRRPFSGVNAAVIPDPKTPGKKYFYCRFRELDAGKPDHRPKPFLRSI